MRKMLEYEKNIATRVKVQLPANIDEYARCFLAIYNNVKNSSDLLKMYNDYGNNIYVVCESDVQDEAIEFLKQFGTIVSTESVEVIKPLDFGYEYRDDIDTEFLEFDEY